MYTYRAEKCCLFTSSCRGHVEMLVKMRKQPAVIDSHVTFVVNHPIRRVFFSFPEIKGIFVHPFLAERIISMLNYFLQHLVGPKMGALKVKDFSEFDFKPQQLVSDICTIYLNLGYVVVTPLVLDIHYRSFRFRVTVAVSGGFVFWTVMKRISVLQSQRTADRTLLPCFPRQLEY